MIIATRLTHAAGPFSSLRTFTRFALAALLGRQSLEETGLLGGQPHFFALTQLRQASLFLLSTAAVGLALSLELRHETLFLSSDALLLSEGGGALTGGQLGPSLLGPTALFLVDGLEERQKAVLFGSDALVVCNHRGATARLTFGSFAPFNKLLNDNLFALNGALSNVDACHDAQLADAVHHNAPTGFQWRLKLIQTAAPNSVGHGRPSLAHAGPGATFEQLALSRCAVALADLFG